MGTHCKVSQLFSIISVLLSAGTALASPWGRADSFTFEEGMSVDASPTPQAAPPRKERKMKKHEKSNRSEKRKMDHKVPKEALVAPTPAKEKEK